MNLHQAIDEYIRDMRNAGRINSPTTERSYRHVLECHAQDAKSKAPQSTNRDDVKTTLRRWPNANTQRMCRSILVSFYRWTVEEGIRPANPAEQTRRPKRKPTTVYRLTVTEALGMMHAALPGLEQRAVTLGICAGLRSAELRGLQGRHFRRPGFIWVSADIAKGNRERWIPVMGNLLDLVASFTQLHDDDYVLHAQRWRNPGINTERLDLHKRPMSAQALYYLVKRVGARAGIDADIHPHLMRHAYGDHIAKHAGLLAAQAVLGHASVETTRSTYVGGMTLDDLTAAMSEVGWGVPLPKTPENPSRGDDRNRTGALALSDAYGLLEGLRPQVALYVKHFQEA